MSENQVKSKSFTEDRIERIVNYLTRGEGGAARSAQLRRPSAFDGVAALCAALPDLKPEQLSQGWPEVAAGVALVGPDLVGDGPSFGQALAEAGYAEIRVRQLLTASGELRSQLVQVALRYLKAKRKSFAFSDAALLLVTTDPDKLARLHERIAYDYCRATV